MRLYIVAATAMLVGIILNETQSAAAALTFGTEIIQQRSHITLVRYYKYGPGPHYYSRPYLYTYPPVPYRPFAYYRYPRSYYYPSLYYFYNGGPRFRY